jgi:Domain of unknown function (DUF4145)
MKRELWGQYIYRKRFPLFACPRCGEGAMQFDVTKLKIIEPQFSKFAHDLDGWEPDWIHARFVVMLQCSFAKCGEVVSMSGDTEMDQVVDEDGGWAYEQMLRPRTVFPALYVIKLDEDVPEEVSDEIKAAFLLYWPDLGASANRLRASVERILDHFKIPSTKVSGSFLSLNERIQAFKKIDPDHAETFDALRFVGNVGTHKDDLKREALLDAFEIYEDALEELFVKKKHKAKIEALKKKIIAAKGQYK